MSEIQAGVRLTGNASSMVNATNEAKSAQESLNNAMRHGGDEAKKAGASYAKAKADLQAQSEATSNFIAQLERQNALFGKSSTEALRYDANLLAMTKSQRAYTEQLLATAAANEKASKGSANYMAELTKVAAALYVLKHVVGDSIKASNDQTAALMGLASVARYAGENIQTTLNKAMGLTKDGMLSTAEATTALKNLLSRGFTTDQAIEMINRLKDSAAFGRQASLGFGEAVVTATEGLKNENSILVDNAGVTKNVSVMWKEYADQIGVGVNSLTQAQKRQAEYNGILRETEGQAGNAALAADSYQGAQARLNKSINDAKVAFGEALLPVLTPVTDGFTTVVNKGIKPMIFFFKSLGVDVGEQATMIAERIDFMTSPSHWNSKGLEAYKKRIKELGDLAEKENERLAASLNDSIKAPDIGKDSGARRHDIVQNTAAQELVKQSKQMDDQMLAAHEDSFTKTIEKWVDMQRKMVAAGIYHGKVREDHERAYTQFVVAESNRREQEAAKTLQRQLKEEQQYFDSLTKENESLALSSKEQEAMRYQRELAAWNKRHEAAKARYSYSLKEEEAFQKAREQIIQNHQLRQNRIEQNGDYQRAKFQQLTWDNQIKSYAGFMASMTQSAAQHNQTMFEIHKAAAVGTAVMNTYQGATMALATYPPPYSFVAAGAVILAGMEDVNQITSTGYGGGGGGGSVPSASMPSVPSSQSVPTVTAPAPNGIPAGPAHTYNLYITGASQNRDALQFSQNDIIGLMTQIADAQGNGGSSMNVVFSS